jgi:2-keto-3-deoxy-6-phosphogluconate aldolase
MTPTEIMSAHEAGADYVKLFPASYLGLKYLKDITAPINHVKLLATGGMSADNLGDFLRAGCRGAASPARSAIKRASSRATGIPHQDRARTGFHFQHGRGGKRMEK